MCDIFAIAFFMKSKFESIFAIYNQTCNSRHWSNQGVKLCNQNFVSLKLSVLELLKGCGFPGGAHNYTHSIQITKSKFDLNFGMGLISV